MGKTAKNINTLQQINNPRWDVTATPTDAITGLQRAINSTSRVPHDPENAPSTVPLDGNSGEEAASRTNAPK